MKEYLRKGNVLIREGNKGKGRERNEKEEVLKEGEERKRKEKREGMKEKGKRRKEKEKGISNGRGKEGVRKGRERRGKKGKGKGGKGKGTGAKWPTGIFFTIFCAVLGSNRPLFDPLPRHSRITIKRTNY